MNSNPDYSNNNPQTNNIVSSDTIRIDPYMSSNMDFVNSTEEPVIEKVLVEENQFKKKRKKNWIITCCLAFVILVSMISTFVICFRPKKNASVIENREVEEDTSFIGILKQSVKSGSFLEEIKAGLKDISSSANQLNFLAFDIDSDENLELVGFVEEDSKVKLLRFEVLEDLYYDDSFSMNSMDNIGYAYSADDNSFYWYIEEDGYVTVLKKHKIVLKKQDFLDQYTIVSADFPNKLKMDEMISYKVGGKLNTKQIQEKELTEDLFFERNQTTLVDVRLKATQAIEEKAKLEAEAKKKQLEEEQKKEIFELNGVLLHYGTYVEEKKSEIGDFTINKDGTCQLGTFACTWEYTKYQFSEGEVPAIAIHYDEAVFYVSSWRSNCLSNDDNWSALYKN